MLKKNILNLLVQRGSSTLSQYFKQIPNNHLILKTFLDMLTVLTALVKRYGFFRITINMIKVTKFGFFQIWINQV